MPQIYLLLQEYRPDLLAFLPSAKIVVDTSVCTGVSNMPPACYMYIIQIRAYVKNNRHLYRCLLFLEVPPRFELGNESFADSCLTAWPRYHMKLGTQRVPNKLERAMRLVCIFANGKDEGRAPSSRRTQQSTGLLHLIIRA